jgi:hypothetical protein
MRETEWTRREVLVAAVAAPFLASTVLSAVAQAAEEKVALDPYALDELPLQGGAGSCSGFDAGR